MIIIVIIILLFIILLFCYKNYFNDEFRNIMFENKSYNILEIVNLNQVDNLLKLNYDEYKTIVGKNHLQYDFEIFNLILKEMKNNNGKTIRTYNSLHYPPFTRKYSVGLQSLYHKFRGILSEGISTDLDMNNSYPNILEYICCKNDIKCTYLKEFNKNPNYHKKQLSNIYNISEKGSKARYLGVILKDNIVKLNNKYDFFNKFAEEILKIKSILFNHKKFKKFKRYCKNIPEDHHFKINNCAIKYFNLTKNIDLVNETKINRYMNCILMYYEQKILNNIIDYLTLNNYKIQALLFDGLYIYGNHYNDDKLIKNIEDYIESIWNFKFKYALKKHYSFEDLLLSKSENPE